MHVHKFGKWGEPFPARRYYNNEEPVMVQERVCEKCGEVRRHEVGPIPVVVTYDE